VKSPRNQVIGLALLAVGLIALALLLPDPLGGRGPAPLRVLFGLGAVGVLLAVVLGGVAVLFADKLDWQVRWSAVAAAEVLFLALLAALHLDQSAPLAAARAGEGGGLVGWALSQLLLMALPPELAWLAITLIAIGAAILLWRSLPPAWASRPVAWFRAAGAFVRGLRRPPRVGAPTRPTAVRPTDGVNHPPPPPAPLTERAGRLAAGAAAFIRQLAGGLLPSPEGAAPAATDEPRSPVRRSTPTAKPAPAASAEAAHGSAPSAAKPAPRPERVPPPKPVEQPASREAAKGAERSPRIKARPDGLPPLTLLRVETAGRAGQTDSRQRGQLLKQTLAEFGVPVEVVSIKEGPTVTQFGLEPGEVVKELRGGEVVRRRVSVHSIQRLSNDLALALAAASIRIEAPVPGRPYVGVEIPNAAKTMVTLRSVLESAEFAKVRSPLAVALGRDVAGDPVIADLTRLPHLLIAGATGSGKSVCINAIISSLLMNNSPQRVRFLMVDPKMVELPTYNGIPHLYGSVITDVSQVTGALAWLTVQMDDRYRMFAERGARNIEEYNHKLGRAKSAEPLPYIILVIDELADLMMTAAYDVERQICRLAQMSRATGIHLVLATQRPSVDVITGLIKANFPARIAFAVTSQIDSRVILDTPGAERLLGRGDMLFMAPDSAKLARIQGCFVSDQEIDGIVGFWKADGVNRRGEDDPPAEDAGGAPWAGLIQAAEEKDELLERALELIQTKRQISISMLQRQLRIGHPRAARLIEQLEEMGAVGPDTGGGRSREVLARQQEDL
jgi:S-DNA-T family DNA segregation ATPase FtsK/SpoIIIE